MGQYLKVSKTTDNKQVYYQNKQSNVQIIGYPVLSAFAINVTCTKYQFTIKRQNIKLFIIYNKHTVRYSEIIDIKCLSDSTYRKYTILLITSKRKGLQHFRVIMICLSLGLWQNVTQGKGEYGVYQNKTLARTQAPSVRGATQIVCQLRLRLYTQSIYLKSYQEYVRYTSFDLCAIGSSVLMPLPPFTP